jgi:hypothetical protein
MTKEELKSELDKVDREIVDISKKRALALHKFDNLFVIKKVTCENISYISDENHRIYGAESSKIRICDEDGCLIKIIFGKVIEIEYFTKQEVAEIKENLKLDELKELHESMLEKEKELRTKILNLSTFKVEKIQEDKSNQKTSFLCKIWGYFKR